MVGGGRAWVERRVERGELAGQVYLKKVARLESPKDVELQEGEWGKLCFHTAS